MGASCAANGCTVRHKKGIKFHRFPNDLDIRKKWIAAIRRDNYSPSSSARLCGKHFLPTDYEINFGRCGLKKGVVPSVFTFSKNLKKTSKVRRASKSDKPKSIKAKKIIKKKDVLSTSTDISDPKVIVSSDTTEKYVPSTSINISTPQQVVASSNITEKRDAPATNTSASQQVVASSNITEEDVPSTSTNISAPQQVIPFRNIPQKDDAPSTSTNISAPQQVIPFTNIMQKEDAHTTSTNISAPRVIVSSNIIIKEPAPSSSTHISAPQQVIVSGNATALPLGFNESMVQVGNILYKVGAPKRKRSCAPVNFGDYDPSDLPQSPLQIKTLYNIAAKTISKQKQTITYLHNRNYQLKKRVQTLTALVAKLKETRILNENYIILTEIP